MLWLFCLLLLGLQPQAALTSRGFSDAGDDDLDVMRLPCEDPGCVKGVQGKVFAFSALHDVILKEVSLFLDLVVEGSDPQEIDVTCLYWSGDYAGTQPLKLPGKGYRMFDNKHVYAPYKIKCPDPVPSLKGMPKWAGFEFQGADTRVRLLVEKVNLVRKGVIGACEAVVFNDQFSVLYEWLHFHSKLGVDGFHIYYTNRTVSWYPSSTAQGSADKFQPFAYPGVSWISFDHLEMGDRFWYSQITLYNDCVYRLRHTYKYVMVIDYDEYLIVRDSRFTGDGGLKALLHHIFPPNHVAVGIYRYAYREDCGGLEKSAPGHVYHEKYTHRLKETESQSVLSSKRFADKLIVRPDKVDNFYTHFLISTEDQYTTQAMNAQPSIVFLKHLRKYDQECSELTEELPFDQD